MNQQTSKTHTDSAHLLRAIERGIVYDRLPAPTAINIQPEYGAAKLRFATAEDVREWAQLTGATVVTGPYVYREGTDSPWHEVGTEQGGKPGELVGWQVGMWASVDGLPPAPEPSDDEIAAEIDAAFAEPQTREIKARYLTAGMAVVSGRVREPLTVMSVLRDPDDSDFVRVVFRFVSGDTLYGVEDAVTVLADEQPATAEPQDGHVYSCCGKTGRISPHKSWCEMNKSATADDAQSGR